MAKYKKGDYIALTTNQPTVHFSWMADCGLDNKDVEPSEYTGMIINVISDEEAYFVYIPSIGFRCVIDASEVLRKVSEEDLSDKEKKAIEELKRISPRTFVNKEALPEGSIGGKCIYLTIIAMSELFPEDKVVSVDFIDSDYLKSDLLKVIDRCIKSDCKSDSKFLDGISKKRDYFKEMLQHLRFKEFYNVRVGVEDKYDKDCTNYLYLAVDTKLEEVTNTFSQEFYHYLGPEFDSVYNFYRDLLREILTKKEIIKI